MDEGLVGCLYLFGVECCAFLGGRDSNAEAQRTRRVRGEMEKDRIYKIDRIKGSGGSRWE